jgi:hypothetical protein
MKFSRFTPFLVWGCSITNAFLNNHNYQRYVAPWVYQNSIDKFHSRALLDRILESRGLAGFERRGEYGLYEQRSSSFDKRYNIDHDKRDTLDVDERDLQAHEDRDIFDFEQRDLSFQEKRTIQKRVPHAFVMGGNPVFANFPADTLTTHGLGACWVVAIVGRTGAVAVHIPQGHMVPGPGGTWHQTVTAAQQAHAQVTQLLNAYHAHPMPGAMGYILTFAATDPQETNVITQLLLGANLSLKTATYSSITQGAGNLAISGDGHHDPVMMLNGNHRVII